MIVLEDWLAERLIKKAGVTVESRALDLLSSLFKSAREGHLCMDIDSVACLPQDLWSDGSARTPLVFEDHRLYLQKNWVLEGEIIKRVYQLRNRTLFPLDLAEQPLLNSDQQMAVKGSANQSLAIITGGPGTGKSFTAGCLIRMLASLHDGAFKVALSAPTGKAAAHLEETLRAQGPLPANLLLESTTLHRLLRLVPGAGRLSGKTVDYHCVVVDESSMLDAALMLHLFDAIGPNTRLVLIGDPEQLPPVEAGSLFAELSDLFAFRLNQSIRMGDGGLLACSRAIQKGDAANVMQLFASTPELQRIELQLRPNDLVEWLAARLPSPLYESKPDPAECLRSQKRFRVLSGLRQGPLGIDELNRALLQRYLLEYHHWIAIPILVTKNDFRMNLYNGMSGVVIRKAAERFGMAYFLSGGEMQAIPEQSLAQYEIGFCLSVHKSQGSEFDEVLALFPPGSERFGREALYTAVTRAKKRVSLVIDPSTLELALNTSARKKSGFIERYRKMTAS